MRASLGRAVRGRALRAQSRIRSGARDLRCAQAWL